MANKKINVLLNVGGNPEVKVDSMVWGKSRLVWEIDPDSDPFIFVNLEFKPTPKANPFGSPLIKDKKITVENPDFDREAGKGQWAYAITVMVGDETYTTEEHMPPEGDKPVIRN